MISLATDQSSDNQLVARIAARDAGAFEEAVNAHAIQLRRIAYRMLGDAAHAEDLAQEALLRLWTGASKWRGDGPGVGAWLRRVVTNLCLDQLRRRKFVSDEDLPERADPAPLADEMLEADAIHSGVSAALDALNERQRAAIILTYYEQLPNAVAAETLDMNVKAFESLLLRARMALKQELVSAGVVSAQDVREMI